MTDTGERAGRETATRMDILEESRLITGPPAKGLGDFLAPELRGIIIATVVLFAVSAFIAPQSVSLGAIASMLPFAAILAVVAIGQTFVIQQGGIDLSVPGTVSLAVVLMTKLPEGNDAMVPGALLVAFAVAAGAGLLNGLIVAYLNVAPIVATLGTNALLIGATWAVSGGASRRTPEGLYSFFTASIFGIPMTVILAVLLTGVLGFLVKRTAFGRRFEATGSSPRVAAAAGMRPQTFQTSAYVAAGLLYGLAGVMLAGVVNTPGIREGNAYLLPSVAVVVLGGTSLLGGKGSVVASVIAALFFTQVDRLVLTLGLGYGIQILIQALALGIGVAFHSQGLKKYLPRPRIRRSASSQPTASKV